MNITNKFTSYTHTISFTNSSRYYKRTVTNLNNLPLKSFPIIQDKNAIEMLFKEKLDTTGWGLNAPLEVEEKKNITKDILNANPDKPLTELFLKKPWDLDSFNQKRIPTIIGKLKNREKFSKRDGDKYFLFMDMPIRLVGKGWKIPVELAQFEELIKKVAKHQRLINPHFDEYNVFLTIDQRMVEPNCSQRRTGWHVDSFINEESRIESSKTNSSIKADSIYVVSDCIPTEFSDGHFSFDGIDPNNTKQVLDHFEKIAKANNIVTFPEFTIVNIDNCVHQVGLNKLNEIMPRTFAKITFSTEILNREGNGINRLFDVDWPRYSRKSDQRNHASVNAGYHENIDQHRLVEPDELPLMFTLEESKLARKNSTASGYLATPGELLQTTQEGFLTTVNIAKPGDWKMMSSTGSQYFLSSEKVDLFYNRNKDAKFFPKPKHISYIKLKESIRLMAPWNSEQFLREGDYLVKRENEIYGILKNDFEMNFINIDKIS